MLKNSSSVLLGSTCFANTVIAEDVEQDYDSEEDEDGFEERKTQQGADEEERKDSNPTGLLVKE